MLIKIKQNDSEILLVGYNELAFIPSKNTPNQPTS